MLLPVVILFAVDAAVLGEARELRLQRELTFTAFEAAQVPLLVHGQEVVPVRDLTPAAGTQGRLLRAHGGHCLEGGWRKSTIKIKPDTPCKTTTRGL